MQKQKLRSAKNQMVQYIIKLKEQHSLSLIRFKLRNPRFQVERERVSLYIRCLNFLMKNLGEGFQTSRNCC